jgi:hypothetical protein
VAVVYTWQNAIDYVGKFVKGVPTSALDATSADTVDAIIWRAWFWKWSMANLTPILLVNNQQDYAIADTNFYRLYRARLRRTDTSPATVREKTVVHFLSPNLEQTGSLETLQAISYNYELGKLRLDKAASVPSGVVVQIEGDYQFQKTKITNPSTAIVFPESYFDVAIAGIQWKYYQLVSDPKAGTLQTDKRGDRVYTGQLGIFHDALKAMAEAEGQGQGDAQRFPDDPLGVGRITSPGLFAWS